MRTNKPEVPAGAGIFKVVDGWTLYQLGDDRYKLISNEPIEGKAGYKLTIRDNQVQEDPHRLKQSRPELFSKLEAALKGVETISSDNAYGDLAVRAGRALTNDQYWARHLVHLRRLWLEWQVFQIEGEFNIDKAIITRFQPIFQTLPTRDEIDSAKAYVFRGEKPDEKTLLSVVRDYHDGKYGAKPMEQLAAQLDMITGVL